MSGMTPWIYILAIAVVALLAFPGCSRKSAPPLIDAAAQQRFWDWFRHNDQRIAKDMQSGDMPRIQAALNDVDSRLQQANPGLSFLFGSKDKEGRYDFVVTADGNKEYFDAVKQFVKTSPKLDGWKLTAFRPPSGDPKSIAIEMNGLKLTVADVQFQAFDFNGKLGITLYPKGLTEANYEPMGNATLMLLDHVVGEYDAVTKIDSMELHPVSEAEKGVPLQPLLELPGVLAKR